MQKQIERFGNNIFKDGCYKELDKIMKKKKTAMNMLYIVANNLSKLYLDFFIPHL